MFFANFISVQSVAQGVIFDFNYKFPYFHAKSWTGKKHCSKQVLNFFIFLDKIFQNL